MIFENLKESLIADLTSIRNNFYITLGSYRLLLEADSSDKLIGQYYLNIDLSALGYNLKDIDSCKSDLECFLKSGLRTATRESYEVIKEYCNKTKQNDILIQSTWFYFLRLLRNGTAHDFKFKFSNSDKQVLPINWHDKSIDIKMDNTPISLNLFGYNECWELLNEIEEFIKILN